MSENKFTPGPWMVSGNGIATKNYKQVCRKPINADKTIAGKCWTYNANLIAAAPELLEALEDAIEQIYDNHILERKIEKAIAKAKGEL